jgi:ABC-type nickel/cobalt efflux system permease component RcnA
LPDSLDPHRWKRIAAFSAIAGLFELGLMFVARLAPAMGGLMRPAYVLVGVVALFMIWHAWRRRGGSDRRQDERRDGSSAEPSARPGAGTRAD